MPDIIIYQMQQSSQTKISLKLYLNSSQVSITKLPITKSALVSNSDEQILTISLATILQEVNRHIKENKIDQFYNILIRSEGNWYNIMQILGNEQNNQFQVDHYDGEFIVQVKLVPEGQQIDNRGEQEFKSKKEEKMLINGWMDKIDNIVYKSEQIYRRVMQYAENIDQDYQIDLAFFYSQPLKTLNQSKTIQKDYNRQSAVSYRNQARNILQNLESQLNQMKHSTNIKIEVATKSKIKKLLNKGIKILHFSCHGNQEELEIQMECQGNKKVGICQSLGVKEIIAMLDDYKMLPQVIVLNACQSDIMAQSIHKHIHQKYNKNITTFGYKGQVKNSICTQFAKKFYSQIFKGTSIQKSIQISTKSLQIKSQIRCFYNKSQKNIFKQSYIELDKKKQVQIKSKISNQIIYQFPYNYLYQLLNYFCQTRSNVVNLSGPIKIGKTLLTKKALFYLHQRAKIWEFVVLDLRDKGYEIANINEFRKEIQYTRKKLIKNNNDTMSLNIKNSMHLSRVNSLQTSLDYQSQSNSFIIFTIDHCDSLLKYENKTFLQTVNKLSRELPNGRILLVSRSCIKNCILYEDFCVECRMINQQQYKTYWYSSNCETESRTTSHPSQQSKHLHDMLNEIICKKMQNLSKQFLKFNVIISFVNIFPYKIYQRSFEEIRKRKQFGNKDKDKDREREREREKDKDKEEATLQKQCIGFLGKVEEFCRNGGSLAEIGNKQGQAGIVEMLYLIAGTQLLIAYEVKQYEEGKKSQILIILNRIQNICTICSRVEQSPSPYIAPHIQNQSIDSLSSKILLLLYSLEKHWYPEEPKIWRINLQSILQQNQQRRQENYFMQNYRLSINQFQQLYEFYKNRYDEEFQDNDYFDKVYFDTFQSMKDVIEKQKKFGKWYVDTFQDLQIYLMYLPMLTVIRNQIKELSRLKVQSKIQKSQSAQKIKIIQQFMTFYKKIFQSNCPFSFLFTRFDELYIQNQFILQKFVLQNEINIDTIKSLTLINSLIAQCKKNNYISLHQQIENFKQTTYKFFISFVSFPVTSSNRFQNWIVETMQKTYNKLKKNIYLKKEALNQQCLQKYRDLKINVPIVAYFVDIPIKPKSTLAQLMLRRSQSKDKINLCLQNNQWKEYQNDGKFVGLSELYFLDCDVAILCGNHIKKIESNRLTNKTAISCIIYIDTAMVSTKKQENQMHKQSQAEQQIQQKIYQISHILIARQLCMQFYYNFCKSMFETSSQYKNKQQQIKKSFETAKLISKIECCQKYGSYFDHIQRISEQISYEIISKQEEQKKMPIQLMKLQANSVVNIDFYNLGNQVKFKRKKQKQKNFLVDNIGSDAEIGYRDEAAFIMKFLFNSYAFQQQILGNIGNFVSKENKLAYFKNKYLILVCKHNEEQALITNMIGRVRRSNLFKIKLHRPSEDKKQKSVLKQLQRQPERTRKTSMDSMTSQIYEIQEQQQRQMLREHEKSHLQIIDLTKFSEQNTKQYLKQRYRRDENILQNYESVPKSEKQIKLCIFLLKVKPLFENQNAQVYQKFKDLMQTVSKLQAKNIVRLLIRAKIIKKSQDKDYTTNWEDNFIAKCLKYLPPLSNQNVPTSSSAAQMGKVRQKLQRTLQKILEDSSK